MRKQDEKYINRLHNKMHARILGLIKEIQKKQPEFSAEYNDDLGGFVLNFGKLMAQTQYDIEQNALHADFGNFYLERYTDYDDKLTEKQHKAVDIFVKKFNALISASSELTL
jgi:hypothetical protein